MDGGEGGWTEGGSELGGLGRLNTCVGNKCGAAPRSLDSKECRDSAFLPTLTTLSRRPIHAPPTATTTDHPSTDRYHSPRISTPPRSLCICCAGGRARIVFARNSTANAWRLTRARVAGRGREGGAGERRHGVGGQLNRSLHGGYAGEVGDGKAPLEVAPLHPRRRGAADSSS